MKFSRRDIKGVLLLLLYFAIPVLIISFDIYAKVSTCGWKGLFVECRIMESPR
jgi:hypothetical protein